jgi:2-(1,2-epoxy-1,2-dihydrophenyl)acetyl-CoA isomerase
MAYSDIPYDKHEAVAIITLDRPQVMNAFTIRSYAEIADVLHAPEGDDSVRVVVITGAGRGFCAGDQRGSRRVKRWRDRAYGGENETPPGRLTAGRLM